VVKKKMHYLRIERKGSKLVPLSILSPNKIGRTEFFLENKRQITNINNY
jgi:hypothetical protein